MVGRCRVASTRRERVSTAGTDPAASLRIRLTQHHVGRVAASFHDARRCRHRWSSHNQERPASWTDSDPVGEPLRNTELPSNTPRTASVPPQLQDDVPSRGSKRLLSLAERRDGKPMPTLSPTERRVGADAHQVGGNPVAAAPTPLDSTSQTAGDSPSQRSATLFHPRESDRRPLERASIEFLPPRREGLRSSSWSTRGR
jgi:hypothetical protein